MSVDVTVSADVGVDMGFDENVDVSFDVSAVGRREDRRVRPRLSYGFNPGPARINWFLRSWEYYAKSRVTVAASDAFPT
jgi:hypothetical protein